MQLQVRLMLSGIKITLESKAAIEAARKAYDALTDAQKKLVSKETLAKLEKAEEELKKLEDNTRIQTQTQANREV